MITLDFAIAFRPRYDGRGRAIKRWSQQRLERGPCDRRDGIVLHNCITSTIADYHIALLDYLSRESLDKY